jgi:hypothetical protein
MLSMTTLGRLATLLALTVTACAAPVADDDDDLEQSSDAVVGGAATFERPEIGAVRRGGGLCTGTLVRPNVVLTAAHCVEGLPKDEDVREATPGYAFEIHKGPGDRQRFAVDRVHSFLAPEHFDGSQRWRAHDIAVLRLVEDVPASLARPARVADRWPRVGGRVAIYGFGCADRAPGEDGRRPGSGTKRVKEHRWSLGLAVGFARTSNLCPGDSGGPLLDLERNAVVGTNSGFVSSDDVFGDVPASRPAIEEVIGRWWPRR